MSWNWEKPDFLQELSFLGHSPIRELFSRIAENVICQSRGSIVSRKIFRQPVRMGLSLAKPSTSYNATTVRVSRWLSLRSTHPNVCAHLFTAFLTDDWHKEPVVYL